jgi:D-glycero-D-manno-heptose 1,7-bisphosphate phosphatase
MLHAAVFFDKDGTLLDDVPYNVDPSLMHFSPGAHDALAMLGAHGFRLFVISNQSGVALGRFGVDALAIMEAHLRQMFADCGVTLEGAYWCPHHPRGIVAEYTRRCTCRKPEPGLILRAAREHRIDLPRSWLAGDILDDIEAGTRAGCRTVLVDNGHETEWRESPARTPTLRVSDLYHAALEIIHEHERELASARAHVHAQPDATSSLFGDVDSEGTP